MDLRGIEKCKQAGCIYAEEQMRDGGFCYMWEQVPQSIRSLPCHLLRTSTPPRREGVERG